MCDVPVNQQSWLVSTTIEASTTPSDWLRDRDHRHHCRSRFSRQRSGSPVHKPYTVEEGARADADFKVEGLPKGKELDTFAANNVGFCAGRHSRLPMFVPRRLCIGEAGAHATIRTFDGLVVGSRRLDEGREAYRRREISHTTRHWRSDSRSRTRRQKAPAAKAELASATKPAEPTRRRERGGRGEDERCTDEGWVYEIPDYKYEAIFKPASELDEEVASRRYFFFGSTTTRVCVQRSCQASRSRSIQIQKYPSPAAPATRMRAGQALQRIAPRQRGAVSALDFQSPGHHADRLATSRPKPAEEATTTASSTRTDTDTRAHRRDRP